MDNDLVYTLVIDKFTLILELTSYNKNAERIFLILSVC